MPAPAHADGVASESLLPATNGWDRSSHSKEMKGANASNSMRSVISHFVVRLFSLHWRGMLQPKVLFSWDDAPTLRVSGTSWLDGLRGVASMQVYFFHFFGRYTHWERTYGSSPEDHYIHQLPIFRSIWGAGSSAVCLFFVISGYAITVKSFTLLRRRNFEDLYHGLCSSVIRRGFRLYMPIFLLAIPTLILFRCVDMTQTGFLYDFERKETVTGQIVHLFNATDDHINPFMYPEYNPSKNRYAYVPTSWTIPMEYHGSIACYILVLVVSRVPSFRKRAIIVGGMALYAIHRGCWWISNFIFGMLVADFTLEQQSHTGTGIRDLQRTKVQQRLHVVGYSVLFFCGWYLAGMCPSFLPFDFDPKPKPGYEFLYSLTPNYYAFRMLDLTRWWWFWSGNLTFLSISQLPRLRSVFETRLCQWLGKLSFPLYLVHAVVLGTLSAPIQTFIRTFTDNNVVVCFGEFFTLTPLIFVCAGVVERYMDRPSISFARWVERYISQDLSVSGSVSREHEEALLSSLGASSEMQQHQHQHRLERV